jgi:hypothetical protein
MGIKIEFNPDLALRNIAEFQAGKRKIEECIPTDLKEGEIYPFFKKELRCYWLLGELPLRETQGNQILSKPKASVKMLEVTHFEENGELFTRGKYQIIKILNENSAYFDGYEVSK